MPAPKTPLSPFASMSARMSPRLAEIQALLDAVAQSERMTKLVDYLDDLSLELEFVSAELEGLGFCVTSYLAERRDGDGFSFIGRD